MAGRAGTTSRYSTAETPPIKAGRSESRSPLADCTEERQHHLNESSSARLRRSQKLEILPSPNSKSLGRLHLRVHTSFIGREDFNGRLVTVVYYETRTSWMWRIYFMYAQIFWIGANVMGANISWAQIFHGREYFVGANILRCAYTFLIGSKYFMCKLLF